MALAALVALVALVALAARVALVADPMSASEWVRVSIGPGGACNYDPSVDRKCD